MGSGKLRDDGTDDLAFGLVAVGLLSAFAGAVDACGLTALKDLFVSFMSGNTTSLGVALGHGDLRRVALIASIVAVFVVGAAAGTMLATAFGRYHLPGIVAASAIVLAIPLVFPQTSFYAMTFAMGALNAAMDHAGSVGVSVTYVTGSLVKLGRGLGEWICQRGDGFTWLAQGVPWIGILCGAAIAATCLTRFGHATNVALPVVALALAVVFGIEIFRRPAATQTK